MCTSVSVQEVVKVHLILKIKEELWHGFVTELRTHSEKIRYGAWAFISIFNLSTVLLHCNKTCLYNIMNFFSAHHYHHYMALFFISFYLNFAQIYSLDIFFSFQKDWPLYMYLCFAQLKVYFFFSSLPNQTFIF